MMEFTLSRIALIICGAILLTAVAVPVAEIYEDRTTDSFEGLAEKTAANIDSFWRSDLDVLYLDGATVLPSPAYALHLEGHTVSVTDGSGNIHIAYTQKPSAKIDVSYGDVLKLVKHWDLLVLEKDVPTGESGTVEIPQPGEQDPVKDPEVKKKRNGDGITVSCGSI